jgi:hypothetical protein
MHLATDDNGQPLVPTGIHWQAAQAVSSHHVPLGHNHQRCHTLEPYANGNIDYTAKLGL